MTVWILAGVALTAAVAALVLRPSMAAMATALTVCVGALLFALVLDSAQPLLTLVERLLRTSALGSAYSTVLLKAFGIGILSQAAADICRDAGESALAGKVEFGGKVLLLLCGLPLIEHAVTLLDGIIRGQAVMP